MKNLLLFASLLIVTACSNGNSKSSQQNAAESNTENQELKKEAKETPLFDFGISNTVGSKFLLYPSVDDEMTLEQQKARISELEKFQYAICNGKVYPIKFSGYQKENEEKTTLRDTPDNFDNMEGLIYENTEGRILPPDADEDECVFESILFVNQAYLDENKLVPFKSFFEKEADNETVNLLEKQYKRKILRAEKVATFGENDQNAFISAQFVTKAKDALGAYMVRLENGQNAFLDFPRTNIEDSFSVWNVDDEGIFNSPSLVAVFKSEKNYIFVVQKYSPESVNTYFIRFQDNKLIAADDDEDVYYRYIAPI